MNEIDNNLLDIKLKVERIVRKKKKKLKKEKKNC